MDKTKISDELQSDLSSSFGTEERSLQVVLHENAEREEVETWLRAMGITAQVYESFGIMSFVAPLRVIPELSNLTSVAWIDLEARSSVSELLD